MQKSSWIILAALYFGIGISFGRIVVRSRLKDQASVDSAKWQGGVSMLLWPLLFAWAILDLLFGWMLLPRGRRK